MPATLKIRVQPRASRNEIAGWQEDVLRVRLTAPPVEGAANKALQTWLASTLGVKRADVIILAGEHSRVKIVRFESLSPDDLAQRIDEVIGNR